MFYQKIHVLIFAQYIITWFIALQGIQINVQQCYYQVRHLMHELVFYKLDMFLVHFLLKMLPQKLELMACPSFYSNFVDSKLKFLFLICFVFQRFASWICFQYIFCLRSWLAFPFIQTSRLRTKDFIYLFFLRYFVLVSSTLMSILLLTLTCRPIFFSLQAFI